MTEDRAHIVPLNQRAPVKAKAAFERRVRETFGRVDGRAGFEFETEVRAYVEMGATARNCELIQEVGGMVGQADREEKFSQRGYPDHSETSVVRYRLPESLRANLKQLAQQDFRSISELVGRIMWRYAWEGGVLERNNQQLERVVTAVDHETDSELSAKEQATQAIVRALPIDDERKPFTMAEFDAAVQDSVGYGEAYARETFLPRVLDDLGYTWSQAKTGVFVPSEVPDTPEETRDPRTKSYELMDDADKERAVQQAAVETVVEASRTYATFAVDDAVDALQGRARRTTARTLMRSVADDPGYRFDADADVLKLNRREIETLGANDASPEGSDDSTDEWFSQAVDKLEDVSEMALEQAGEVIARNKIARARYPGEVEDEEVSDDAMEQIPERAVRRVLDAVTGTSDGMNAAGSDDQGDSKRLRYKADTQFSELSRAAVAD